MRNEYQCWAIRNCFNSFLNVLIVIFLFLREGGNLFHLIDNVEVNFFLAYLMQWVISWCSLMKFVLCKSPVLTNLYSVLFYFVNYRVNYK